MGEQTHRERRVLRTVVPGDRATSAVGPDIRGQHSLCIAAVANTVRTVCPPWPAPAAGLTVVAESSRLGAKA